MFRYRRRSFSSATSRGTSREGALLELFIPQSTYVLSFTRILNEIGFDPGNNIVDASVSFGGKKINLDNVVPLILTVHGNGSSHVQSFLTVPIHAVGPCETIGPGEGANTVEGVCEAKDKA